MIYFLPLEVLLYCFFDVRGKDERVYFLNTLDQFQRPLDVPRVYGTFGYAVTKCTRSTIQPNPVSARNGLVTRA
jgi:hypothetical protein